jgi:hypothetical protein
MPFSLIDKKKIVNTSAFSSSYFRHKANPPKAYLANFTFENDPLKDSLTRKEGVLTIPGHS